MALNAASSLSAGSCRIAATRSLAVEDVGQRTLGRGDRRRDLVAGGIDPARWMVVDPAHDLQRRVVELLGQRASQLGRPRAAVQAHGEPLHRRPR